MSEQAASIDPARTPAKPSRKRRRRRAAAPRAARAVTSAAPPAKANPFAGVTATKCCDACTAERCVISTVATCKHPLKTGDSGCGPVTMANRDTVRRIVKRERADV